MEYLSKTYFFDFEEPIIQEIIQEFKTDSLSVKDKAVKLYLKIRDNWRYNPYQISLSIESYKASQIAKKTEAHCIDKSVLLITCLRGLKIPARIHLVKVKNHIGVERFIERFGTNEISPHGMVDIYLDKKWIKVSPAFNKELCEKCNVAPLDFDGEHDSIFQEYNRDGQQFMKYIEDYGHFEDLPMEFIFNNFKENYPSVFEMFKNQGLIDI
jgi:transglutaminase-like putative cysteine protease